MGSFSGDDAATGQAACASSLTEADRVLLLAANAWGDQDEQTPAGGTTADLLAGFRNRLAPAWLQTLGGALGRDNWAAEWSDPSSSIDRLRRMHRAMAKVDLTRVHSSWLVRALREESPSVQRLVAASLGDSLRHRVQAGLLLDSRDLVSERAADPEVASWVMELWTERLVGDEAERMDDSPAVAALVRLKPPAGYRLCRMAGFCKLILAGEPLVCRGAATYQARHNWLAGRLAEAGAELKAVARRDVETSRSSRLPARHHPARIGLTTVARLIANTEPFRLRWALQHWPYPIAKLIRSIIAQAAHRPASLLLLESWILKTAWERLNLEGSFAVVYPESDASALRETGSDRIARPGMGPASSLADEPDLNEREPVQSSKKGDPS